MLSRVSAKKRMASIFFPRYSRFIEKLNWTARWLSALKAAGDIPVFRTRPELHHFVCDRYAGQAIDYMEFGVWQGASLRMWIEMNQHPKSRFFGFDSFVGLPEDWGKYPKGTCDVAGKPPDISDQRVKFYTGWFQDSVPGFLAAFRDSDRPLVIHCDADL